jgi:hypothetical protein
MLESVLAACAALFGYSVLIATPPTRNVGLRTLDLLDGVATPRLEVRPLLALRNQPNERALPMPSKFSREPGVAEKFDSALPEKS